MGVISSNKPDGERVAEQIAEDFQAGEKAGRLAFEEHLNARGVRWVTFDDWKFIDEAEIAAADDGAPRRKFVSVDDMISFIKNKKSKSGS